MLLFSKKDLILNADSDTNIIIITGVSGAGKTTMANELKDKIKYEIISFDILFNYELEREPNDLENEIITSFLKKYPKYKDFSKNKNSKTVCTDFYLFVEEYVNKNNIKILFDGAFFMNKIDYKLFKKNKIIYKRTSILRCIINRQKRTTKVIKDKNYSFIRKMKEYYWSFRYSIKTVPEWIRTNNYFVKTINER